MTVLRDAPTSVLVNATRTVYRWPPRALGCGIRRKESTFSLAPPLTIFIQTGDPPGCRPDRRRTRAPEVTGPATVEGGAGPRPRTRSRPGCSTPRFIPCALAAAVLLVFSPALLNGFVDWDDHVDL